MAVRAGFRRAGIVGGLVLALSGAAQADLTHRYSFTDGAKDSVGKADGKLVGKAAVADGKLTLANGEAASGDAGISYVEFAEPLLPKEGSASIAIWFTAKEAGAFSRLVDIGAQADSQGEAFIYISPHTGDDMARVAISATDPGAKSNVDGDRLDDGKPHLLLMVIDGKAAKLHFYVDGKAHGEATDLGDNTLNKVKHTHQWIGRSGFDIDAALSAVVDEVRVYDDALSPESAAAIAKAGADTLAPAATAPTREPEAVPAK